ncbi:coiled-coil domain-containing protein 183-like [Cottoperca gobio]|uniref:Coiled-coil domain-containing protein 183-like n=1 Tax=Cottoperca gobio TaxID=56716 RepID=A0A6J2QEC1_COTGO|nr:coiled-coil domain-containing protein 183 [Cottoperca gobio]
MERLAYSNNHQCYDICGASQSNIELVEEMEALREDLDCADLQRIRQLENSLEKMKMKITQAKKIQNVYQDVREHLQQVRMVQMEHETMAKKREMDIELCELSAEEKELKRLIETHLSPTGQSRLNVQEIEELKSIPATDHQCYDICGASQSDIELVEEMEALREDLDCADLQELVTKISLQRATTEQLLTELTQQEELAKQEANTLTELELQFDKLKGERQAALNQEVCRVEALQAELQQCQDLLNTVEQGVDNVYLRMSCVPVEGLPSASSTESIDKLRDVSLRLPTLLQRASQHKPETSGLDQERLNRMESRNISRPSTPIHSPPLSDDEKVLSILRENQAPQPQTD